MYKILKTVIMSETMPQNNDVLWLRKLKEGFAFYTWNNGYWEVMKLMNGQDTPDIDDDTPYTPGGGGEPGPNTVGTDAIIDNSIMMNDLNDSVKSKIHKIYDEEDESLSMDYDEKPLAELDTNGDNGEDDI